MVKFRRFRRLFRRLIFKKKDKIKNTGSRTDSKWVLI